MDLDNAKNQVEKADGVLTSLTKLLKKHWLLLVVIGISAFIWWAITSESEYEEPYYEETYYDE